MKVSTHRINIHSKEARPAFPGRNSRLDTAKEEALFCVTFPFPYRQSEQVTWVQGWP